VHRNSWLEYARPAKEIASAAIYGSSIDTNPHASQIEIEESCQLDYAAGMGGGPNKYRRRAAAALPFSRRSPRMNKTIIVSIAILSLSTSAALAAKHHSKKPDAAPAATMSAPTQLFVVSSADKELYAKNKRASGMK
jgi:hypothetical protein